MSAKTVYQDLRESIELSNFPNLLEQLVTRNESAPADEAPPLVEIHLSSGYTCQGTPIKIRTFDHRAVVAIRPIDGARSGAMSDEVVYIDAAYIVALKVHNPLKWRHELSFGKQPKPLNEEPLTRLNARRIVTEEWEKNGAGVPLVIAWDSFPQTDFENNHIRRLALETRNVLNEIKADPMGLAALKNVIGVELVYVEKASLSVAMNAGKLVITTDARGQGVSPKSLKEAIEACL